MILLERDDHVGGAAVSAEAFAGVDARLSRYSYLVSLLPKRIIQELDLDIRLARRRYSSYTPNPSDTTSGLLVDHGDRRATRDSFDRVGAADDFAAWNAFYRDTETDVQSHIQACDQLNRNRLLGRALYTELGCIGLTHPSSRAEQGANASRLIQSGCRRLRERVLANLAARSPLPRTSNKAPSVTW